MDDCGNTNHPKARPMKKKKTVLKRPSYDNDSEDDILDEINSTYSDEDEDSGAENIFQPPSSQISPASFLRSNIPQRLDSNGLLPSRPRNDLGYSQVSNYLVF